MFLTSCTPNIFFFASFDFRTRNQRFPKFSHLNKHNYSDVSVELVSFPAFTNNILLSPRVFPVNHSFAWLSQNARNNFKSDPFNVKEFEARRADWIKKAQGARVSHHVNLPTQENELMKKAEKITRDYAL